MRVSIESTDWPAAIAYSFCVEFNRKSRHFVLFVWIEPENLVIKLCKCFRYLVFGAVFCRYFLASFLLKIETYITLVFMIKIFTFFYLSSLLAVCLNLALRGRVSVSLQTLVFFAWNIFLFFGMKCLPVDSSGVASDFVYVKANIFLLSSEMKKVLFRSSSPLFFRNLLLAVRCVREHARVSFSWDHWEFNTAQKEQHFRKLCMCAIWAMQRFVRLENIYMEMETTKHGKT